MEDVLDVLIVGGGAGGLNAALMLSRTRRRVLVIDSGDPRNAPAREVHGFVSRDGTPPAELLAAGRAEVERYGGRVMTGEVRALRRTYDGHDGHDGHGDHDDHSHGGHGHHNGHDGNDRHDHRERNSSHTSHTCHNSHDRLVFEAELADGRTVLARRVIVATGLRDELPDIPGLRERWAREVLHCPYCHGWEVRDQPLGVLAVAGREAAAVHQALLVRQLSHDVVCFAEALTEADRARLTAGGIRIVDGAVGGLVVEDDALRGVRLADGTVVARSALFVPTRPVPRDELLTGLGCARDEDGRVRTDPGGLTSVPGVWAAGNAVDVGAHVVTAAAGGAKAALAVNLHLIEEDLAAHGPTDPELAAHEPTAHEPTAHEQLEQAR
ncbi:NAD(P)/FAD-dependent oxidoreductase [Streptomyces sp. NPDC048595]|uniref:NAD(P)/FAD-dependent oxidoreductase n=1 Tax=Streptomyces sp. NPDC048595 TaxID=3365576 RepID=UPI00371C37BB